MVEAVEFSRELYGICSVADDAGRCFSICPFFKHDERDCPLFDRLLECGQLSQTVRWDKEDHNIDELYSEDLY